MKFNRKALSVLPILSLVLTLSTISFAKTHSGNFPGIKIDNFGQMDDQFFRGARPDKKDFPALAALGIKTIIDLTDNSRDTEEPAAVAAGLRYINIPIVDKSYPSMESVNEFLKVVNDPATGKFYVHCAGGRHRTGVMGAVYRFNRYNWNYDQVYAEMKKYDFYTRWGHGDMKKFVQDYAVTFQSKQSVATAVASQEK